MIYNLNCFGYFVKTGLITMTTGPKDAAAGRSAYTPFPSRKAKQLPSLADIMKAPLGRAAIEELVAAGVAQERLEAAVQFVLFVQIMPAVRTQDVRGLPGKSLATFPEELRRTATRIEMIRRNPLYRMAADLFLPGSHWEETCKNLKAHAVFWDAWIRALRQAAKDNPREYDLRLFAKRNLMAVVAEATGKPHFNRLAELLNASYGVVDLSLCEEGSALRHLWKNHVQRRAKRRYPQDLFLKTLNEQTVRVTNARGQRMSYRTD